MARSRAIDRLRAKKARKSDPQAEAPVQYAPDPAMDVDEAQRAKIVRAAIAGLDAGERTALEMAYFSDLSQTQIAERLEIPLGTVKTRIRSAMIKLREVLEQRQK